MLPTSVPMPLVPVLQRMGIEQFWNIPVIHCPDSYALILKVMVVYHGHAFQTSR